ncbi:hypothetical protein M378DRAFT_163806 [Amanita muscaria Koide BX008]|uniref:Uncharacterized protein n=1 Tax=Amanita muscaria (strain Koide BX008) TaxID=946122 RepID=A0A0C2X578_AMAMK|nr:hypothetical protein M378DRAFT_163806 [Amanita muscaria Koide BX008]
MAHYPSHPYSGSAGYIYANNELKTVERPPHRSKAYGHLKSFMPGTASMEVLSLTGPKVHSKAATVTPSSVSSPYSRTVVIREENDLWPHDGSGWTKSFFDGNTKRNDSLHSDWTPPGPSRWFDQFNSSNRGPGRTWPIHWKRLPKKRIKKLLKSIRDSCMSGYRRGLSKLSFL